MAFRTGNPALNKKTFEKLPLSPSAEAMTVDGVTNKSLILLIICVASAVVGWRFAVHMPSDLLIIFPASLGIALAIALVLAFKRSWAPVGAPLYAFFEGIAVGIISQLFDERFDGVVLQALVITGCIFVAMLLSYRLRIIKVTENFKAMVVAATLGIAIYYVVHIFLRLFTDSGLPLIASTSWYGIGFTVAVIIIAALNLILDFDFIEQGVKTRAPKYMEWYGAYGLLVTVVWLYIEVLRLLAKLKSR